MVCRFGPRIRSSILGDIRVLMSPFATVSRRRLRSRLIFRSCSSDVLHSALIPESTTVLRIDCGSDTSRYHYLCLGFCPFPSMGLFQFFLLSTGPSWKLLRRHELVFSAYRTVFSLAILRIPFLRSDCCPNIICATIPFELRFRCWFVFNVSMVSVMIAINFSVVLSS